MFELRKTEYGKVSGLLHNIKVDYIFAYAVLDKIQEGHIYVDDVNSPKVCMVVSKGGKYLVAGNEENLEFIHFLELFLKEKNNHANYFDLYVSSEKWLKIIGQLLETQVVKLGRCIYSYRNKDKHDFNSIKPKVPEGYLLKEMDKVLYNKYVKEIDPSYSNTWGDANSFLKNGFGYCILYNGEFVSTCNTFYVGGGYAEIDIMTNSKYRTQGFASITACAFIEHCLEQNLIPNWDADLGNEPSNKLATKLGFHKDKNVDILWWHENQDIIKGYLKKYNY